MLKNARSSGHKRISFTTLGLLTVALLSVFRVPHAFAATQLTSRVTRALHTHIELLLVAGFVFALIVAIFLHFTGRRRLLWTFLLVSGLSAASVSWYAVNQRFPRQAIFDAARLGDGLGILLGTDIPLSRFQPEPLLVVEREDVLRASYPAIDIHFHLESLSADLSAERMVRAMDAVGIAKVAHLGSLPDSLQQFATAFVALYPDRFVLFARPDFQAAFSTDDGVERQVQWIEVAAKLGARGLKVQKSLGTYVTDQNGQLVGVDDPRLDPIWRKAGELGMPVLIHTSDPTAFFMPPDERNERLEEMLAYPQWVQYGKNTPSKEALVAQRDRLVARHPGTNFIGAHMGSSEDNLARVAALLDRLPNYYVDMASVIHALGRQPVTARRFFIQYQDRILFGTDGGYGLQNEGSGWTPERYFRSYIEFLETSNEYIEYPLWGINNQGRWRVYGLDLPDEVLEKIYVRNAEKLLPTDAAMAKHLAGRFPALESGRPVMSPGQ